MKIKHSIPDTGSVFKTYYDKVDITDQTFVAAVTAWVNLDLYRAITAVQPKLSRNEHGVVLDGMCSVAIPQYLWLFSSDVFKQILNDILHPLGYHYTLAERGHDEVLMMDVKWSVNVL